MTTVITGASGHIGANLVREMLARGRACRAVVYRDTRALGGLDVERVTADLADPASLQRAFTGADTVFHLAARISIAGDRGGHVHNTNVRGTREVVRACLACRVRRLVYFSSIHAFCQRPLDEPLDETRRKSDHAKAYAYDHSKALAEKEIQAGIAAGLDAVIVNPTGVIGPYDFKPSRMGQVLLDLYHGRFGALVQGGFDWVDVRDAVAGALAAEEKGRCGENYLLPGTYFSFKDLAALIERTTGRRMPRFFAPLWLARPFAPFALAASRVLRKEPLFTPESLAALRGNRRVSRAKAEAELGYRPRPIEETIRDAYAWFREAGMIDAP